MARWQAVYAAYFGGREKMTSHCWDPDSSRCAHRDPPGGQHRRIRHSAEARVWVGVSTDIQISAVADRVLAAALRGSFDTEDDTWLVKDNVARSLQTAVTAAVATALYL